MANIVSYTISLKDKYSRISDRVRAKSRAMRKEFKQQGKDLDKVKRKYQELGQKMKDFGGWVSGAGRKLTLFSGLVGAMGVLAIREAARMETLSLAYEVFIGDVVQSKKVLGELIAFADRTPFQVKDIANAGKLMMAYGLESSQLLPTMKKLGDLSAGTGSNLQRVALVHGQILAMNRLQGRDNLQLAQMGINVIEPIAKRYSKLLGKTISQAEILKEMERSGGIPMKVYLQAIDDLTAGTGRFKGMTERLSVSLVGRWSTLVDAVERMGREVGKTVAESTGLNEILVSVTSSIVSVTDSVVGFTSAHPGLTKILLILTGMALVFGPILLAIGAMITLFGAMVAVMPAVATGLAFIATALGVSVGALFWIPLAIAAVIVAFTALYVYWDDITAGISRGIAHLVGQFQWLASAGMEAIRSGWSGKALEFLGVIETAGGDSNTTVDVNLNAPRGAVSGMTSKTTGAGPAPNIGLNMATAR